MSGYALDGLTLIRWDALLAKFKRKCSWHEARLSSEMIRTAKEGFKGSVAKSSAQIGSKVR